MTNRYPLHHEDAEPLYKEITQDEYDRINSRIAELEEERRWRKFPDEKPELGDIVLAKLSERVKHHYFPMEVSTEILQLALDNTSKLVQSMCNVVETQDDESDDGKD